MENAKFIIAAYAGVWVMHMLYVWSIGSRQKKISEELEILKRRKG